MGLEQLRRGRRQDEAHQQSGGQAERQGDGKR